MPTKAVPTAAKKKPTRTTLSSEAREYLNTMTKYITQKYWTGYSPAPRFFEKLVCSCNPLRNQLDKLMKEEEAVTVKIDDQIKTLEKKRHELRQPYQQKIQELRVEIGKIDRVEHPIAETLFKDAKGWVRIWVLEKIQDGSIGEIAADQLPQKYLEAVAAGWRPKPPEFPSSLTNGAS